MGKTIALILAGGAGTRLDILSKHRAKPATPFGGKYRIVDFTLSNCINSNIFTVGVLTQYMPRSLTEHIGIGKPWDLDRSFGGITILPPYQRMNDKWYKGTANAVYQNLNYVEDQKADNVIILAGDHIYKMDYQKMIELHEEKDADITIAVKEVDGTIAHQFGIVEKDKNDKIIGFEEKPLNPKTNLASMGIYIFKYSLLKRVLLNECGMKGSSDFGKHIIPRMIKAFNVYSYEFDGYWKDVGTVDEYWKANLELIKEDAPIDIYDLDFNIYTKSDERAPGKILGEGTVKNSLISNGCVIKGYVENSVLSPGVIVEEGVIIKDSIIFMDTVIKKDSLVHKTIIDKRVVIEKNCKIGVEGVIVPNKEIPDKLYTGINLIGKFVVLPEGTEIEKNCRIMSKVDYTDLGRKRHIKSGESIHSSKEGGYFELPL
ncbi:MAG: glucose-1-phosphate adenylyltransferase [Fusobacteriaceae bacterium]|nr:glucose-1-phosphate adenylyltransferase [Fusobacteriaceae bacterium]